MADQRLAGKVAVVTGATSGIGEAVAVLFAEQGARVVVSGRNEGNGRRVVEAITAGGGQGVFIRCDVGADADCDRLIAGAVQVFGGLDVLVNNAAITNWSELKQTGDVAALPPETWDKQIAVDLRAAYYLSHLAIPEMKKRGGGSIVNVSSVGGLVAWPGAAAYLTAKGGLHQLTRAIAVDHMADNIRANALAPGWILTPPEERRITDDPAVVRRQCEQMGIRRMGTPREMAFAALFLACEESSYVTGTVLVADGGWTLR